MNLKRGFVTIALALIIILSFVIRIFDLNSSPAGALSDEASYGYNAYSIAETGRDEHGAAYPLVFKAFGDQKLPANAYLTAISVSIFGLNNMAVRLPSALAGILLVLVIFFLLRELKFNDTQSLVGSLIVAVSPWTIILSRFGYESNLALLFFAIGIFSTLVGFRTKQIRYAMIAGLFFGLTWYAYIAYKLITPIVLLCLIIIFSKEKKYITKFTITLCLMFAVTITPLLIDPASRQSFARFNQTTHVSNEGMVMEIIESRTYCSDKLPQMICYVSSNKILSTAHMYISRYVEIFSPQYLFLKADQDNKYLSVDNYGLFYVLFLPFYLIGIMHLITQLLSKKLTKQEVFVIVATALTPLASVLAGNPQKIRLSPLMPFILFLILFGVGYVEAKLRNGLHMKIYYAILGLTSVMLAIFFMIHFLSIHIEKHELSYGSYIPRLMHYLGQQNNASKEIYIKSITEGIVYYNEVDPKMFHSKLVREKTDDIGFSHAQDLENIHITREDINAIYCKSARNNDQALYVTNERAPDPWIPVKEIKSENAVYTYAYIYSMNQSAAKIIDCTGR